MMGFVSVLMSEVSDTSIIPKESTSEINSPINTEEF